MKRLVLPEGLSRYTVTSGLDVRMVINQNAETLIELNAEEDMECTWEIRVLSGVKATVFFLNQALGNVVSKIRVYAEKDAVLKVGVLEFGALFRNFIPRLWQTRDCPMTSRPNTRRDIPKDI